MVKKIGIFVVVSFVMGNTVAWFSGAAPIEFAPIPFSQEGEQRRSELTKILQDDPDDLEAMIFLGSLYSSHNYLDKADELLSQAIVRHPDEALALAFYHSNQTKISGAMLDLSMGIYKLHRLQQSIDGINQSVALAPEDFFVRINRLITFGFLGDINSDFDKVFEDERWLNKFVQSQGSHLPQDLMSTLYVALANAYWVKDQGAQSDALNQARFYLTKLEEHGGCPLTSRKECHQLKQLMQQS